jgi:hypothetical protein
MVQAADGNSVADDPDRVDSHASRVNAVDTAPFASEHPQSRELCRCDCLKRMAKPIRSPGFDLDKSYCSAGPRDEVDFAMATSPPAIEYLVTVRDKKVASNSLTPSAQFVFACHCSSPIRVGLWR